MTTTVYLWRANQSEPDHDDSIFAFTDERGTPPPEPTRQVYENGLADDRSLYDDWQLIGEVDCEEMFNNHLSDCIVVVDIGGYHYFAEDVYRFNLYRSKSGKPKHICS